MTSVLVSVDLDLIALLAEVLTWTIISLGILVQSRSNYTLQLSQHTHIESSPP